jgi:hypothetical protein
LVKSKGITPLDSKNEDINISILIARKIGKEGTNKQNHLAIYDQVITPARIDDILGKINKINVTAFIDEVNDNKINNKK